ncbi:MAG: hypothetical protein Kow0056_06640 [Coriobacteriia bacterium]
MEELEEMRGRLEADEATNGVASAPPRGRTSDTATRVLVALVFVTVVAILFMVIYILYAGLLKPHAPRTAAEREVAVYERLVQEEPGNAEYQAQYVAALVKAGQLDRAQAALEDAKKLFEDAVPAALMVEEARLLDAQGDSDAALGLAKDALDAAQEEREEREKELAERGTEMKVEAPAVTSAALLAAEILEREGEWEDVVEYYGIVLQEDPTAADVLVARGNAYEELGRIEEARADYQAALTYIPDYAPALEALKALGE